MAGPGIRYLWFARELARRGHEVTLVVPFDTDLSEPGFEVVVDNPWHAQRMTKLAERHDGVVAQRLPVPTMLALARSPVRTVFDFYAPIATEGVVARALDPDPKLDAEYELNRLTLRVALETGDAFVCASDRQRDLWMGALAALGRVEPEGYRRDPTLRSLVDVVPFGIDPRPPEGVRNALKGVVPGIAETDRVALWGGGVWNWLDPLTVIRAVDRLARPEVKLVFLGTRRPEPALVGMEQQARAIALARELGLLDRAVFFVEGWVPYAELGAYLLESDVGVAAHADDLETRYAFRTRLLDCIWAGLPIVTTGGDSLSELVRERGLGGVVAPGDVDGFAAALAGTLDTDRSAFAAAMAGARTELEWPRVVEPLAALLEAGPGGGAPRPARATRTAEYAALRARHAVATRGVRGLVTRAVDGVRARARGDRAAHPTQPR
jgi:glycosyltransferase involved in cell wall biosynthesis